MTLQNIIDQYGQFPKWIIGYYVVVILFSLLGLLTVSKNNFKAPISYGYTALVYLATIPGVFSVMLVAYNLFFLRANLLQLNIAVYFVPIIGMLLSLMIIHRTVPMSEIPGFDRLSGLILVITMAFILTYILQRMFFGVLFIGSFTHLILLFLVILVLLRLGWKRVFK
ncbi:hypothetical protein POV27_12420 [Aureisphaera galaxeae]|uniref:hypothetical protein n=1 Tax=Aureisphaera galaxeae TaxID=1538023 RepID=UPI0023504057|nr:hypothetical protein [Aureisphaera galaxeae]MDC8004858.1 hypothetical protein [Aureisphaera galaxeae]